MAKNMKKQQSVGLQPSSNSGKQSLVIPHVLEHLDRDDAIKLTQGLEIVHILS